MSKKLILQNSLALFFRMLVTLVITLYSVRLLIDILGITAYGVYAVVAGFLALMNFFNQSFSISFQRFYSYNIGKGAKEILEQIFSSSLLICFFLSIFLLIISETVGLWFLHNKITIPNEVFSDAVWLFHFSVLSAIISIFRTPYISVLIANENMKWFATINILDSFLRLLCVIILPIFYDNLLFYFGLLLLVNSLFITLIYAILTSSLYKECNYKFIFKKKLFNSIIAFSLWSNLGVFSGLINIQGNNILMNIFFGPVANAAREVSTQIQNAFLALSNSIYLAFKPQIIQNFAENKHDSMIKLFYLGNKLIFLLGLIFCLNLYINIEFILSVWLNEINELMIIFSKLSLIYVLVFALNNPISTIVQATGKVKKYHIIIEFITSLTFPLTFILYSYNFPAEVTYYIAILIFSFAHILRLLILKNLIVFSIFRYIKEFIFPSFLILIVVFYFNEVLLNLITIKNIDENIGFLIQNLSSVLLSLILFYRFALLNFEKELVMRFVKKFV